MRRLYLLVVLMFAFSCSDSDPRGCDPEDALLRTIVFDKNFKYVLNYDSHGNVISVVHGTEDGKMTWWKETYTWEEGILESYQRELYVRDEAGNLLDTYIAESCTYGYSGDDNQITLVMATTRDSPGAEPGYSEIDITYNNLGLPETFTGDDDITYTWYYAHDAWYDVFGLGKEGVQGLIVSQNFTDLKNYWPSTYQFVRTYTRDGKFNMISRHAPMMTVHISDAGVVQYTTKYYYEADSRQKIESFKIDVSSCPGCNPDRRLTYSCID